MSNTLKPAIRIFPAFLAILLFMLAGCEPGIVPPPAPDTNTPISVSPIGTLPALQATAHLPEPSLLATPESQGPAFPAPYLSELVMVSQISGWGLSDRLVLHTDNGGKRWHEITPPGLSGQPAPLQGYFLDGSAAWIITSDPQDPDTGLLYHTIDSGQSWATSNVPFGFAELQFLDRLNGWAMAGRGAAAGSMAVDFYQTSDGGSNWIQAYTITPGQPDVPGNLPFSGVKSGMSFRDASHGWVTGSVPIEGFVYLYATQDGGKTWSHQDLPLPVGWESAMLAIEPPHYFDQQNGVLPASSYSQAGMRVFYVTKDGGATWTPTSTVVSVGLVSTPTPDDFFIWDGGLLHASHDGGRSWSQVSPNIDLNDILAQMDFVDQASGWATSMDASGKFQLYNTVDGGITWEALLR